MKEIKPTLPPAPTTGRGESPDEPMFMPEEHAVAVARNDEHPVRRAINLLKVLAGDGLISDDDQVSAEATAEHLGRYWEGTTKGFVDLQARLDIAERAFAKFMDDVASALQLCEVPEEQAETPDWVLRELRNYVQMNKPKQEAYAGFSREDIVGFVESMAKEHNVTEITESLKRTPLRAIRTLVETIAKRKSPTALRGDLDRVTGQLQEAQNQFIQMESSARQSHNDHVKLMGDLRELVKQHSGEQFDNTEGIEDPIKALDNVIAHRDRQINNAYQDKARGYDELRELVSEFGGGWVDHPMSALRDMLETLTKNQKPDGMDNNVQTVITANARLNATLQAIEAVINTAKV